MATATTATTKTVTCPICYEDAKMTTPESTTTLPMDHDDDALVVMIRLRPCHHEFCMDCAIEWFRQTIYRKEPDCPQCLEKVNADDVGNLLNNKTMTTASDRTPRGHDEDEKKAEDNDEELNPPDSEETIPEEIISDGILGEMQIKECRNCGAYIVREEGCDAMQCLCGHRFCWDCHGTPEECCCGHDAYFDNVLEEEVEDTDDQDHVEATKEQLLDLKSFMEAHRKRLQGETEEDEEEEERVAADDEEEVGVEVERVEDEDEEEAESVRDEEAQEENGERRIQRRMTT